MRILAADPYIKATAFKRSGAEKVALSKLLKQSDFVSLHVPLTAETRGLMHAENFAKMKPTAFLINTCRGPVVSEKDLLWALDKGLVAGGAIDVFEEEPLSAQSPLRSRPQLLLTPHTAGVTRESQIQMSEHAAQQVRDYFFSG
jgi:phosphoglycerate dehydrogenase-like enzyme